MLLSHTCMLKIKLCMVLYHYPFTEKELRYCAQKWAHSNGMVFQSSSDEGTKKLLLIREPYTPWKGGIHCAASVP